MAAQSRTQHQEMAEQRTVTLQTHCARCAVVLCSRVTAGGCTEDEKFGCRNWKKNGQKGREMQAGEGYRLELAQQRLKQQRLILFWVGTLPFVRSRERSNQSRAPTRNNHLSPTILSATPSLSPAPPHLTPPATPASPSRTTFGEFSSVQFSSVSGRSE